MEILLFCLGIFGFFGAFLFLYKYPYYGLPFYYFCIFLKRLILPDVRVRETVAIQLMIITICCCIALLSYRKINLPVVKIPYFNNVILFITIISIVETIVGILHHYLFFSILIDIYKVVEIVIFFFFLKLIWRTKNHVKKSLKLLVFEMLILGMIEIFITERGGTGLNILMSIFPFLFAAGFYQKNRYYWINLMICLLIVLMSQTRTYMMGFALEILMVLLLCNGKNKNNIKIIGFCLLFTLGVLIFYYMTFIGNDYIKDLINRILELSEGFAAAGGYRVYEIQTAMNKFFESPIFGKGFGYSEYLFIQGMGYMEWGSFLHNVYIEILLKTGLFGCVLYGFGLISYISKCIKKLKLSKINHFSDNVVFCVGGLSGTVGWLFIYFAAPLSSYGVVFLPTIISFIYYYLSKSERDPEVVYAE